MDFSSPPSEQTGSLNSAACNPGTTPGTGVEEESGIGADRRLGRVCHPPPESCKVQGRTRSKAEACHGAEHPALKEPWSGADALQDALKAP